MGGIQFGVYKLPDTIADINNLVTQISTGLTDLEGELSTQIAGIKPAVKSIQRGVAAVTFATTAGSLEVTVSEIVVNKSLIKLASGYYTDETCTKLQASGSSTVLLSGQIVSTTKIKIFIATALNSGAGTAYIPWDLIEYN